jgi:GNAT superfamily N-acetyltransferase
MSAARALKDAGVKVNQADEKLTAEFLASHGLGKNHIGLVKEELEELSKKAPEDKQSASPSSSSSPAAPSAGSSAAAGDFALPFTNSSPIKVTSSNGNWDFWVWDENGGKLALGIVTYKIRRMDAAEEKGGKGGAGDTLSIEYLEVYKRFSGYKLSYLLINYAARQARERGLKYIEAEADVAQAQGQRVDIYKNSGMLHETENKMFHQAANVKNPTNKWGQVDTVIAASAAKTSGSNAIRQDLYYPGFIWFR